MVSPTSGTVLKKINNDASYGNHVILRTNDNKVILMAHMRDPSPLVAGNPINESDFVGYMGATGNTRGDHLHIEVENSTTWAYNSNLLRPSQYIDFNNYWPCVPEVGDPTRACSRYLIATKIKAS